MHRTTRRDAILSPGKPSNLFARIVKEVFVLMIGKVWWSEVRCFLVLFIARCERGAAEFLGPFEFGVEVRVRVSFICSPIYGVRG